MQHAGIAAQYEFIDIRGFYSRTPSQALEHPFEFLHDGVMKFRKAFGIYRAPDSGKDVMTELDLRIKRRGRTEFLARIEVNQGGNQRGGPYIDRRPVTPAGRVSGFLNSGQTIEADQSGIFARYEYLAHGGIQVCVRPFARTQNIGGQGLFFDEFDFQVPFGKRMAGQNEPIAFFFLGQRT
jgi:hypothetical protein